MSARIGTVALALALAAAGCGGGNAERAHGDGEWHAHPPTVRVQCGAAIGVCPHGASLRVRWPDGAHAPADARVSAGGHDVDAREVELGVCAPPGHYALQVESSITDASGTSTRSGAAEIEILAGAQTRVALAPSAVNGRLDTPSELVLIDTAATVAALGDADLPTIDSSAGPEDRRVFTPMLAAAFDAWRERLARVHALAETEHDALLVAASADHVTRAESIRATVDEVRPSTDRLVAIRRAMQSEIEDAAAMIAVEHECPLYADREPEGGVTQAAVEARAYVGERMFVSRIRVAIDDVEVLDAGSADGGELFASSSAEGALAPGDHVVAAEATFAARQTAAGGHADRHRVLREAHVVVPRTGGRIHVRARESDARSLADALVVEIGAE
jgi:hypothetical protein